MSAPKHTPGPCDWCGDDGLGNPCSACGGQGQHPLRAENERLREALEAVLVEGNRLCVACCHLDGDGTYDETRCWNEVRTDARAALAKGDK